MNEVDKVIKEACDAMRRELDGFEQSLRKAREALDVPEIKEGDVVKCDHCWGVNCLVLSMGYGKIALKWAEGNIPRPGCLCLLPMDDINMLTLIRKGPRKRIYEMESNGVLSFKPDNIRDGKMTCYVVRKGDRMTLEPMDEE